MFEFQIKFKYKTTYLWFFNWKDFFEGNFLFYLQSAIQYNKNDFDVDS